LIHRDHRKGWESSSALGQIIWRVGPVEVTTGDVDMAVECRLRDGRVRMLLLEKMLPTSNLDKKPQRLLQRHLALILEHAVHCDAFSRESGLRLDEDSGFYLIVGALEGKPTGRREVFFVGPQSVRHLLHDERAFEVADMRSLNDWLHGGPGWTWRRPPTGVKVTDWPRP
jgi:hypothetical protein